MARNGKSLIIVESPTKTKTLKKFLGKGFEIQATLGHVKDLPKKKLGVDIENGFAPAYETIVGKGKVIDLLKKSAKSASIIYLALDPDREGEAIAQHVAEILDADPDKVKRAVFDEITERAVKEGIANAGSINKDRAFAQQARRILDRIVGYKVSPILWKTISKRLSAGRVQSVALRLICEREDAIEAFKPTEYWSISAEFKAKAGQFIANLATVDGKKIQISNNVDATKIVEEVKSEKFSIRKVKVEKKSRNPLPPFITSTMQQEAARRLYFSTQKTMRVAQSLYEGVEIGEAGSVGLITYMRTDSVRISNEALSSVRSVISQVYGKGYLPDKANHYKNRNRAQDAHEAVRPTYFEYSPQEIKIHLTKDQFKLYSLIWERFIASQMMPAQILQTSIECAGGRFLFRASGSQIVFDGFLRVYEDFKEEDANGEDGEQLLPAIKEGENLKILGVNPKQHFTKPPPRYTEASLVKELESKGIGRPSTYAQIIDTLEKRKYTEIQQRRFFPTELGRVVNKVLTNNFDRIFNVEFTAEMETELDKVELGTHNWQKVLQEFYVPFHKNLLEVEARKSEIKKETTKPTGIKCDKCGGEMVEKWGRHGKFLACSAYPNCKNTKPLDGQNGDQTTNEQCPECGSGLVVKNGRFGRFLACSKYPDCKFTKSFTTGVKCPEEVCDGEIVERRSRKGKPFYSCSNYPKCKFAMWNKPVKQSCPQCDNSYQVEKYSKAKGNYLACPKCGYSESPHPENIEKHQEEVVGK